MSGRDTFCDDGPTIPYEEYRKRRMALHSAEREVLEACVREQKAYEAYRNHRADTREALWASAQSGRELAVRRYRALLDTKEAK